MAKILRTISTEKLEERQEKAKEDRRLRNKERAALPLTHRPFANLKELVKKQ